MSNAVPVKSSKPETGKSATRSPASQVSRGQVPSVVTDSASKIRSDMVIGQGNLSGNGGGSASAKEVKTAQMKTSHSTVTNPVANTHGAQPNKGELKVGPQDSTAALGDGKKKKSAAQTMYPNFFPLKE